MRTLNPVRPHAGTTRRTREHAADARRPNPRRIADAVIAGYIHDISRASRHAARAIGARDSRLRPGT